MTEDDAGEDDAGADRRGSARDDGSPAGGDDTSPAHPAATAAGPADRGDAASPANVRQAAREFERRGRPYARATVVRREPPVSANVGDTALVTADGDLVGWIGGVDCARSVVVREAVATLERETPVLIGLAPDPSDVDRPGVESFPMTCHSGGTLEVFVEPVTPAPALVVVGESPVARALARLAGEVGFDVTVVVDPNADEGGSEPDDSTDPAPASSDAVVTATDAASVADAVAGANYAVVASMGAYDELGLEAGLRAGTEYLGLVASGRRRDELARAVAERIDAAPDAVADAVTSPAGVDVGAETPEEIAVSVLAELVAVRRDAGDAPGVEVADAGAFAGAAGGDVVDGPVTDATAGDDATADAESETPVDPVCGMAVDPDGDTPTVDHAGETYYFCGEGCADAFADDPDRYAGAGVSGDG